MNMICFKHASVFLLIIIQFVCIETVLSQCDINSCNAQSKVTVNSVYFDNTNRSINLTNVEFKNLQCNSANFIMGLDVYVYQLLPDGTRDQSCNVLGTTPDNVLGFTRYNLGKTSFCGQSFTIDTIKIDSSSNFIACDGATYEVEVAVYATTNIIFSSSMATVYSLLNSTEYEMLNLGTVTANTNNAFAGNGQPLLINNLSLWQDSQSNDTITVPCNTDVPLFLQAQSIIADCPPYGDYSTAIPSEMSSVFVFSENEGFPVVLLAPNLGYEGGQQTGADAQGLCYGGIYTETPYIFEAQNLTQACDSTTVMLTLYLNDSFTGQTTSKKRVIQYVDSQICEPFINLSGVHYTANYLAADSIYSNANMLPGSGITNLKAQHRIKLTSGFKSGLNFNADIESCQ